MANDPAEPAVVEQGLKLEKLRLEVDELRRVHRWNRRLGQWLPLFSALIPVLALLFTVQQFTTQQRRQIVADSVSSARTFMEPVLERTMDVYFEASAAAATIASTEDAARRQQAIDAFWRLYHGPMVMLESPEVSGRMIAFGDCLRQGATCADSLGDRSHELASSLQRDLFSSWRLSPAAYAQRSIDYARRRDSISRANTGIR
jgi:hypothetical protein